MAQAIPLYRRQLGTGLQRRSQLASVFTIRFQRQNLSLNWTEPDDGHPVGEKLLHLELPSDPACSNANLALR